MTNRVVFESQIIRLCFIGNRNNLKVSSFRESTNDSCTVGCKYNFKIKFGGYFLYKLSEFLLQIWMKVNIRLI